MDVQKLAPGLWRWTAPHPDWTPDQGGPDGWERDVGCIYYEGPDAVVLIDPLVPADEPDRFWQALDGDVERAGRPVVVLRTVHWHERSTGDVVARYPDTRVWNKDDGGRLPVGVDAHPVERGDETLFWIAEHRALVAGDVLLGTADAGVRVCPDSWLQKDLRGAEFRASLRYLLDLPIEMVLVSHGQPVLSKGHEALAAALV